MLLGDARFFTCEGCGERFETDRERWSDAHAMAEMEGTYGHIPEDQRCIVCDDCYVKCMELLAKEHGVLQ
jgi:hypothetical protein